MSDARKTLTIPASELRVGDHIINYGVAKHVTSPVYGKRVIVDLDEGGCCSFCVDTLLTIERHEPEVIVRYFADRPEDGFASLDEIECGPGWAVTKFTWHDGVLHSVEIVAMKEMSHE